MFNIERAKSLQKSEIYKVMLKIVSNEELVPVQHLSRLTFPANIILPFSIIILYGTGVI